MLPQQNTAVLRGSTQGIRFWEDVLGIVEASSEIRFRHVDLDNPIIYLKVFKTPLEFDISPHARRRPEAGAMNIIRDRPLEYGHLPMSAIVYRMPTAGRGNANISKT